MRVLVGLLLALAAATSAFAADEYPVLGPRVEWARKPTGSDMASHYPAAASARGLSGSAIIACRLQADGTLARCQTVAETPEGYQFGEATVRLARFFRMKAQVGPTGALTGGLVFIPVAWNLPYTSGPAPRGTVGLETYVVQPAGADDPSDQTIGCKTSTGAPARCRLDGAMNPEPAPWTELAPLIRASGDERTIVQCTAATDGPLQHCQASGGSEEVRSAVLRLLAQTASPKSTAGGANPAGRPVLYIYDWARLKRTLAILDEVLDRKPAS